jgi:hypothetical protein
MAQQSFLGDDYGLVTVQKIDGSYEKVSAEIMGQVAVHRTLESGGWSITHILSGRAVLEAIVDYTTAIEIAKRLAVLDLDTYWNAGCCASKAFYQDATRIIKDVAVRRGLHHRYQIVGKVCDPIEEQQRHGAT